MVVDAPNVSKNSPFHSLTLCGPKDPVEGRECNRLHVLAKLGSRSVTAEWKLISRN